MNRGPDESLDDQFGKLAYNTSDDRMCISLEDVKTLLATGAPWIDDLFRQLLGKTNSLEMEYADFIDFLETGKSPSSIDTKGSGSTAGTVPASSKSSATALRRAVSTAPPEVNTMGTSQSLPNIFNRTDIPVVRVGCIFYSRTESCCV